MKMKIALSICLMIGMPLCASQTYSDTTITKTSESADRLTLLTLRLQEQLDSLDHIMEKIGLSINSAAITVENKKVVLAHVLKVRKALKDVRQTSSDQYVNKEHAMNHLYDSVQAIILHLQSQINDGFTSMDTFQGLPQPTSVSPTLSSDFTTLEINVDTLDYQINYLEKEAKYINVTLLNKIARKVGKVDKKIHFSSFMKRSLPYVGLGLYWAWTQDHVPDVWPFKHVRTFLKGPDTKENNALANSADIKLESHGFMAVFHKYFSNVVTFGKGHKDEGLAVFHIALGALMYPTLKKDASDLSIWIGHKVGAGTSWLKGMTYDDGSLYKEVTKARLEDVVGAQEAKMVLQRILDYYKQKKHLNFLGAYTERIYTLVGPFDTSKLLANGIAGEISALYKAKNKSNICHVYTLHSSDLVNKELKEIMKEAKEKDKLPCIILIEDLDWLYTQSRVDAKVWSNIAVTLEEMLKSKKKVFIFMTIRDEKLIDSHHKKQLGAIVHVPYPTSDDRAEYFKKQLEKRSIVSSNFDLIKLAALTDHATFDQLGAVIHRGITIAQLAQSRLMQNHLETAVTEVIQSADARARA